MGTLIKTFELKKAFLVDHNGIRQYIRTSVTFHSDREIELFIKFPDRSIYSGKLLASNSFEYKSINGSDSEDYTFTFNCFWNGSMLLLSGTWQRGPSNGEIYIHGSLQNNIQSRMIY